MKKVIIKQNKRQLLSDFRSLKRAANTLFYRNVIDETLRNSIFEAIVRKYPDGARAYFEKYDDLFIAFESLDRSNNEINACKSIYETFKEELWFSAVGEGSLKDGSPCIYLYIRNNNIKKVKQIFKDGWFGFPVIVKKIGSIKV